MTIKLRFAPSPTGLLHIGNARAALINWLFNRKNQLQGLDSQFLLRLDDTDTQRSTDSFAQAIEDDLGWLGLNFIFSFKQSERFDRYHQIKTHLINIGRLYPCYETQEELEFKRKRNINQGIPPIYDRSALNLTSAERDAFDSEGKEPHWRFLLHHTPISWVDLIRGETEFNGASLSDPVLIRADGTFLYTLTSVVDDIDLGITHILRGEDHVTNTAVQLQLFEALNHSPSQLSFGHTTLLMDAQGIPLSKRLSSLSLHSLREEGVDPMAINSLLARLGTSKPIEPHLTLDKLAQDFDLSSFSRTPPRFDLKDLKTLNHKLYQITPFENVQDELEKQGFSQITPELWDLLRGNLAQLKDIASWIPVCFGDILPLFNEKERDYLTLALDTFPSLPWNEDTWGEWTSHLKKLTNRHGKDLFMPLRSSITGMNHGPEMKFLLPIIGYEKTLQRLQGALA